MTEGPTRSISKTRATVACFSAIGTLAIALVATSPAIAQTPRAIATFGDWGVFEKVTGEDKICFAATEAKSKQPTNVKHGDVFFLVATWKSGAAINQPSLMTGYNLRAAPEPKLRVGSDSWEMYSSENEAFVESDADERRLVSAMRRGSTMRVSAMSERGTATSYNISLSGVTAALRRVEEACR
ncbi:MAG: invasion associated locus B family protein [Pseudomonadota bacterium]